MNKTSQSTVPFGEPFPTVTAAVAALTQRQLDRLLSIARRRVERLTQSLSVQRMIGHCDASDFVHDAIMLVLVGELNTRQGRHTHPRHLAGPDTFFNFMQGIVHSRISAKLAKTNREGEYISSDQAAPESRTVAQDAHFNEIKAILSARLRAAAGDNPALQSTLMLLELEPTGADQEPSRFQLHKMRKLGRTTLREMAAGMEARQFLLP